MNPIFAAALEIQDFCRERRWRFGFVGGVAVQRWGEPRLTQDVDLTLVTGFGKEEGFVAVLLDRFRARRADARDFALRHRVLLLESKAGTPIDIALGAMPFGRDPHLDRVDAAAGVQERPNIRRAVATDPPEKSRLKDQRAAWALDSRRNLRFQLEDVRRFDGSDEAGGPESR